MRSLRARTKSRLAIAGVVLAGLSGCSTGAAPTAAEVGEADGVVTVYGPVSGYEAVLLQQSWEEWEATNGIDIQYEASGDFEAQIGLRAQTGNAPDLAIFRQPGYISDLASLGYIEPTPDAVAANVAKHWPQAWTDYGTFDGVLYASPLMTTVEGLIWYSPSQFEEWGLQAPLSWDQLVSLTETIRASELVGRAVWCAGFASDSSTGSAGTDWIETIVIRQSGIETYDKWVNHEIPFTDPAIASAFETAGGILLDGNIVNAGIGNAESINRVSLDVVAAAMAEGTCALHLGASSFVSHLEDPANGDLVVAKDGDIWAFIAPPMGAGNTVTVSGEFLAAFSNDSDTVKVQEYLSTSEWATSRVALGGALSTNRAVDHERSALLQLAHGILSQPTVQVRFDASDSMPGVVGAGSFVTAMTDWIAGKPTSEVLTSVEESWPRD